MNSKISTSSIMKLVNILFLIVLENFIHDCGMGFWVASFLVMVTLYTILFSGMQYGISKTVSIRNNKGLNGNTKKILNPALIYAVVTGIFILLFALLGGKFFCANVFGVTYPTFVFQLFALLFVVNGITDILVGYQNGNGNGIVTNFINLLRAILPVLLIFPVYNYFHKYGGKVSALLKSDLVVDVYSTLALTLVYAISFIIILLIVIVFSIRTHIHHDNERNIRSMDSKKIIYGGIFSTSFKIGFNQLFPVLSIVTVVCIYLKYICNNSLDIENAYINIGIGFSKLWMPIAFVFVLFEEYVAREKHRLHVDIKKDDYKTAASRIQYIIKNTFFMLLPPTMILTFLAEPFVKVFFSGQYTMSTKYLQVGGFLLLFSGLAYSTNAILKSVNREVYTIGIRFLAFLIQIVFFSTMIAKNQGDSLTMLYSFYLYFTIEILLNLIVIFKTISLDYIDIIIKTSKYGASSLVMMILFLILDKFILMNIFLILLSMFLGYLLYYLTLLALKGISKKDELALKKTLNYYPVTFLRSRLRL